MALNVRQTKFLAEYLKHGIGVRAARDAGYRGSDPTLRAIAAKLLTNPNIAQAIAEANAAIMAEGIACKAKRIEAQQARWEAGQCIVAERAAAHPYDAPGSNTGWLVRTYKVVGTGPGAHEVEEWSYDTGLAGEMRQLEQHTAKELGQWVEKSSEQLHASEDFLAALRAFAGGADPGTPAGPAEDSGVP